MKSPDEFLDEIQAIRAENNKTWMQLVRLAWRVAPEEARKLSQEITENDKRITELSAAMSAEPAAAVRRVILPGGGILHTYAVKEAQALGLVPVVTDRDPACPCAKMPGVEFHEIDCYDVEAHLRLLLRTSHVVGAFCAGAETYEVVAALSEATGRPSHRHAASLIRNKRSQKERLIAHSIPTPQFAQQGPAIFKPTHGSGSRGVLRVESVPPRWDGGHYEEILEGPEQSVEILLHGGESIPFNIVDRRFSWVGDQPLELGHTNPSKLPKETQDALYSLAHRTASAFGIEHGFFKIDSILHHGVPHVLECTPRLSGGFDSQVSTPLSSGRNPIRFGLQLACDLPLDLKLLERTKSDSVTIIHRPHLAAL
jgi:hypothetical protein